MNRLEKFGNFVEDFFEGLFQETNEKSDFETRKYRYYISHQKFEICVQLDPEEDRIEITHYAKQRFEPELIKKSFFNSLEKENFHCQYSMIDCKNQNQRVEGVYGDRAKKALELKNLYNTGIKNIDKRKVHTYYARINSIVESSISVYKGPERFTLSSEEEINKWIEKSHSIGAKVIEKEKEFVDWVQTFDSDIKVDFDPYGYTIFFGRNELTFWIRATSKGYRLKLEDFRINQATLEELLEEAKIRWTKHYEKEKVRALL